LNRSVDTGKGVYREGVDKGSKDIYDKVDKSIRYLFIFGHESKIEGC